MKCKYCTYEGSIFSLQQHITQKSICKNKYTQDDLLEFEKIYEPYKKSKRKTSKANYNEKNKRPKGTKVIMIFKYLMQVCSF